MDSKIVDKNVQTLIGSPSYGIQTVGVLLSPKYTDSWMRKRHYMTRSGDKMQPRRIYYVFLELGLVLSQLCCALLTNEHCKYIRELLRSCYTVCSHHHSYSTQTRSLLVLVYHYFTVCLEEYDQIVRSDNNNCISGCHGLKTLKLGMCTILISHSLISYTSLYDS